MNVDDRMKEAAKSLGTKADINNAIDFGHKSVKKR